MIITTNYRASAVTLDAVSKIAQADTEDDIRFPRTAGELGGKNRSVATDAVSSSNFFSQNFSESSNAQQPKGHVRSSSTSSTLSLNKPPVPSSTSSNTSSLHISQSMSNLPTTAASPSTFAGSSRPVSSSSPNTPGLRKTNSMTMGSTSGSNKVSTTAAAPAGEDFFSNFGV